MYVFFLLIFGIAVAKAQPLDTLWCREFGEDTTAEQAFSVEQTPDGGFLLAGYTGSGGAYRTRCLAVRTDANGETIWTRSFGSDTLSEGVCAVLSTSDGNFLLVGEGEETSNESGILFLDISANGDSLWSRNYFVSDTMAAHSRAAAWLQNGDIIAAGYASSSEMYRANAWLMQASANGDSLWYHSFGGDTTSDAFLAVKPTTDGIFAAGFTGNSDAYRTKLWIIKTDFSGELLWSHAFGADTAASACQAIHETMDGGFLLGGYTGTGGAWRTKAWILKTDANGDTLWSRKFGHDTSSTACYSIEGLSDGGFVLSGFTGASSGGNRDLWLMRINSAGDSLWSYVLGGDTSREAGFEIEQLSDGGFVIAGYTGDRDDWRTNAWLIRTTPELSADPPGPWVPMPCALSQNYPNPFNANTTISFDLPSESRVLLNMFDITGRKVVTLADEVMVAGGHVINFDAGALPSGIYIYRLQADGFSRSRKLVVLK
jgi:hypothetical protein